MDKQSMVNAINETMNETTTTNGDVAFKTTFNKNLDLFYSSTLYNDDNTFYEAVKENPSLFLANLLYLRDIRGGLGKRQAFRDAGVKLANEYPELFVQIVPHITDVGRWDDLIYFVDKVDKVTKELIMLAITLQLSKDLDKQADKVSLLGKWLPSENASNKETIQLAKFLINELEVTPKEYRKILTYLRSKINLVENHLRKKDYESIDYSKLPGRALKKYRAAFERHDCDKFNKFVEKINLDKNAISSKVDNLYPHEIIHSLKKATSLGGHLGGLYESEATEVKFLEGLWNNIDLPLSNKKTIVVRDGSYSMTDPLNGRSSANCLDVADALTLLFAKNLTGELKNHFITFSAEPSFIKVSGESLYEDLKTILRYDDALNTNIEEVYKLILEASRRLKEEDRIERVIIVSDMQFDSAQRYAYKYADEYFDNKPLSTYEEVKNEYQRFGVKMPEVVFWNVGDFSTIPYASVEENYDNVKLVGGFSNHVLKSVIADETVSATEYMMKTLQPYIDLLEGN